MSDRYSICVLFLFLFFKNLSAFDQNLPIIFPDEEPNIPSSIDDLPPNTTNVLNDEELTEYKVFEHAVHSINSIEQFASYFDLNISVPVPEDFTVLGRLGPGQRKEVELEQAVCSPTPTHITLDLPNTEGVTFFPTCVMVNRCSGCCLIDHHSCQPTEIEHLNVKVIKVNQKVTRSRRRRRTQRSVPEFISVSVEQHNSCNCGCKLQQNDCNPATQEYIEPLCQCICKNKEAQSKCIDNPLQFWRDQTCECFCRTEESCFPGFKFSNVTCGCEPN